MTNRQIRKMIEEAILKCLHPELGVHWADLKTETKSKFRFPKFLHTQKGIELFNEAIEQLKFNNRMLEDINEDGPYYFATWGNT